MKDLTQIAERFELFEERLGITIEGLFVGMEADGTIHCNGEVHPRTGTALDQSVRLVATCHDSTGRVLARSTEYLTKDQFYGFESFEITFYQHLLVKGKVAKVRIYPEKTNAQ